MSIPTIIMSAIMAAAVVSLACALFMLQRNEWVYRVRSKMIDEDWATYQRLPTYDAMMSRFWVWDVRAFLPPEGSK